MKLWLSFYGLRRNNIRFVNNSQTNDKKLRFQDLSRKTRKIFNIARMQQICNNKAIHTKIAKDVNKQHPQRGCRKIF